MALRVAARLLTSPLAFLAAGVIDIISYSLASAIRSARRRLDPSTMPRR